MNATGSGFAARSAALSYLRVRFGAVTVPVVWVSTSELRVVAPEHAASLVAVELTLNDQQYTSDGVHFEYEAVVLHTIEPRTGPVRGGTAVTLFGGRIHAPGADRPAGWIVQSAFTSSRCIAAPAAGGPAWAAACLGLEFRF